MTPGVPIFPAMSSAGRDGSLIIDLFAGCRGWSEGLRTLGLSDIGIEVDMDACRTAVAAGHATIRADVAAYPAERFHGATGLIASPPCPDFSAAGKGAGRAGKTGWLVDTVPRWVETVRPRWIACEQVPPAEPIWHEHADIYRRHGYSVWVGVLNAADFGVAQTRRRAFLLASLDRAALPPEPTHGASPRPGLFGTVRPWVSMADALGWEFGSVDRRTNSRGAGGTVVPTTVVPTTQPAPTLCQAEKWLVNTRGERTTPGGNEFSPDGPSWALTEKTRSWKLVERQAHGVERQAHQPAMTITSSADNGNFRFTPDWAAGSPIRLTIEDALTLQSFRPDYPLHGSRSSQFTQVGNAVPPVLAAHVLAAVAA